MDVVAIPQINFDSDNYKLLDKYLQKAIIDYNTTKSRIEKKKLKSTLQDEIKYNYMSKSLPLNSESNSLGKGVKTNLAFTQPIQPNSAKPSKSTPKFRKIKANNTIRSVSKTISDQSVLDTKSNNMLNVLNLNGTNNNMSPECENAEKLTLLGSNPTIKTLYNNNNDNNNNVESNECYNMNKDKEDIIRPTELSSINDTEMNSSNTNIPASTLMMSTKLSRNYMRPLQDIVHSTMASIGLYSHPDILNEADMTPRQTPSNMVYNYTKEVKEKNKLVFESDHVNRLLVTPTCTSTSAILEFRDTHSSSSSHPDTTMTIDNITVPATSTTAIYSITNTINNQDNMVSNLPPLIHTSLVASSTSSNSNDTNTSNQHTTNTINNNQNLNIVPNLLNESSPSYTNLLYLVNKPVFTTDYRDNYQFDPIEFNTITTNEEWNQNKLTLSDLSEWRKQCVHYNMKIHDKSGMMYNNKSKHKTI